MQEGKEGHVWCTFKGKDGKAQAASGKAAGAAAKEEDEVEVASFITSHVDRKSEEPRNHLQLQLVHLRHKAFHLPPSPAGAGTLPEPWGLSLRMAHWPRVVGELFHLAKSNDVRRTYVACPPGYVFSERMHV